MTHVTTLMTPGDCVLFTCHNMRHGMASTGSYLSVTLLTKVYFPSRWSRSPTNLPSGYGVVAGQGYIHNLQPPWSTPPPHLWYSGWCLKAALLSHQVVRVHAGKECSTFDTHQGGHPGMNAQSFVSLPLAASGSTHRPAPCYK